MKADFYQTGMELGQLYQLDVQEQREENKKLQNENDELR